MEIIELTPPTKKAGPEIIELTPPTNQPEQQATEESTTQPDPSLAQLPEGVPGPTLEDSGLVSTVAGGQEVAVSPLVAGIDRGIAAPVQGVQQLILEIGNKLGIVDEQTLNEFNANVNKEIERFKPIAEKNTSATVGRVLGEAGVTSAIPGGSTIKGAALTGAGLGGTAFIPEGGDATQRLKNAATGGAAGGTASALLKGGGKVVSKGVNTIRGKLQPQAEEVVGLSKQFDVPVSVGDVTQKNITKRIEGAAEAIPVVGFSGFRDTQQKAAARAAKELVDGFAPDGDWAQIVQSSARNKADIVRKTGGQLFNKTFVQADKLGVVPTNRMNSTAKRLLDEELLKVEAFQDKELVSFLQKYATPPEANMSGLNSIRSDLSDDIANFFKGRNAIIGKRGVEKLQEVKVSLDGDMDAFANQAGGSIKKSWERAKDFWKRQVIPFKDKSIAKIAETDTPDEIYKKFIKRDGRDRAKKFFNALDKNGKDAVRFGMLEDAMNKATSSGKPFSPALFAQFFEQNQAASGVFFKARQKAEIDGFTKLMRHVVRAGQFAADPPTGKQVIPVLLGFGAAFDLGVTAKVFAASAMIKALLGTDKGRTLMLSANSLKPGSVAMQRIFAEAEKILPRVAAIESIEQNLQLDPK